MLSSWCWKLKLDTTWVLLMVCVIVGNELKPYVDDPSVGKDMSVNSRSHPQAKLFWIFVNELLCIS